MDSETHFSIVFNIYGGSNQILPNATSATQNYYGDEAELEKDDVSMDKELTPKHLSGVVKEVSGKTVGEWIDELVILEAKALLNSSSMNIQEIADRLNFANQSFFGKYFKHYTGMSPKEYRKSR